MSDLDNFFAKKDKTKKNKKKGVSNDDLEKKFDLKNTEVSKGRRYQSNLDGFIQDEGQEWNDFEDEDNKDYSGLRIQALSMKDKEEEQREEEESIKKEQVGQPWKVSDSKEDSKTEPEPKAMSQNVEQQAIFSLFRKKGPRLDDANEFPDLGASKETLEDLKTYQTVRSNVLNKPNSTQNESISTDNKYNALRNN